MADFLAVSIIIVGFLAVLHFICGNIILPLFQEIAIIKQKWSCKHEWVFKGDGWDMFDNRYKCIKCGKKVSIPYDWWNVI